MANRRPASSFEFRDSVVSSIADYRGELNESDGQFVRQSFAKSRAQLSGRKASPYMNKDNGKSLASHYSGLLFLRNNPRFECADGWSDLIEGVFRLIERYIKSTKLSVRVVQVKQKLGLLRIYHCGVDEDIDLALHITELVSAVVCECCGRSAEVANLVSGVQARCSEHLRYAEWECIEPRCPDEKYADRYADTLALIFVLLRGRSTRLGAARKHCPSRQAAV